MIKAIKIFMLKFFLIVLVIVFSKFLERLEKENNKTFEVLCARQIFSMSGNVLTCNLYEQQDARRTKRRLIPQSYDPFRAGFLLKSLPNHETLHFSKISPSP